jgi:hypothetical protein
MALHDAGADALLRAQDACYELVWTLDAATGQRRVGVAHLRRLQEMFRPYQGCAGAALGRGGPAQGHARLEAVPRH